MKLKIGVMAAAGNVSDSLKKLAFKVGEEIAKQGCTLITGATTGLPYEAAKGAKKQNGLVIGISPANNEREHAERYRMPTDNHDAIIYTGFGYKGRNVLNIRSSDAIIVINGSVGTLNEFTIAFAEERSIGVLEGSGGIADIIKDIRKQFNNQFNTPIIYEKEPEVLVKKLVNHLNGDVK
ncbi:hypothetical protein JXA85_02640 [Candidatus Woesearchaeota archaeon]|nr:hypothetical protein [Candidatus Woesearchaeota archaeon]